MKKSIINLPLLIICLLITVVYGLVVVCDGCGRPMVNERNNPNNCTKYSCPMHPDITSTVPGKCRLCNLDMTPLSTGGPVKDSAPGK
jgi:hypothetical protein